MKSNIMSKLLLVGVSAAIGIYLGLALGTIYDNSHGYRVLNQTSVFDTRIDKDEEEHGNNIRKD